MPIETIETNSDNKLNPLHYEIIDNEVYIYPLID
jgi:hypothetical protein